MKSIDYYRNAHFITSAAEVSQFVSDTGSEVAFAGRSNAGKSTALNALTQQKSLAKTSKTPGKTQLINFFEFESMKRFVDLPGYGYAQVPHAMKLRWNTLLKNYFIERASLKGVIILMDIRHPMKELDQQMIDWAQAAGHPCHLLLTKADKLSRQQQQAAAAQVKKMLEGSQNISLQVFSAVEKIGLEELCAVLYNWFHPSRKDV